MKGLKHEKHCRKRGGNIHYVQSIVRNMYCTVQKKLSVELNCIVFLLLDLGFCRKGYMLLAQHSHAYALKYTCYQIRRGASLWLEMNDMKIESLSKKILCFVYY